MNKITYYWSRIPDRYIDKQTGEKISKNQILCKQFSQTGRTVREWYEKLYDILYSLDKKLLEDETFTPCEVRCNGEIMTIFECLLAFRPHMGVYSVTGTPKHGTLHNRYDLILDYTIPRDEIHIERNDSKGIIKVLDI